MYALHINEDNEDRRRGDSDRIVLGNVEKPVTRTIRLLWQARQVPKLVTAEKQSRNDENQNVFDKQVSSAREVRRNNGVHRTNLHLPCAGASG